MGLAMVRTMKTALSVDTRHPSLFCDFNGPAEQEFDYFHFTKMFFAHQQIRIGHWLRTFTLFCLHLSAFDSQLHFTPAYYLRHFFPYSPISYGIVLHQQSDQMYLQFSVRRYAPMWGCDIWKPEASHCTYSQLTRAQMLDLNEFDFLRCCFTIDMPSSLERKWFQWQCDQSEVTH